MQADKLLPWAKSCFLLLLPSSEASAQFPPSLLSLSGQPPFVISDKVLFGFYRFWEGVNTSLSPKAKALA